MSNNCPPPQWCNAGLLTNQVQSRIPYFEMFETMPHENDMQKLIQVLLNLPLDSYLILF